MIGRQEFFAETRGRAPGYTTEQLYAAYETYLTCPRSRPGERPGASSVDCVRCGNCCRRPWRVEVSLQDALRWAADGRHDILAALEHRPRERMARDRVASPLVRQLAARLAGQDEDDLIRALAVAGGVEGSEGSYVLPRWGGCRFLIDGEVATCSIYETRPEVCRRFPEIK